MRYYNILDFKLQELYVFTVTAEFESITKAANYLYLTPSQVSKIIKKLEYQWGVELFIRDKNSLRLTPAGKHAYKGLNNTLESVKRTLDEIVHIQAVKPFIRIGCPSLSDPNELFAPMIQRFLETAPNTEITIECKDNLPSLRKMLLANEVDLIYTSDFEIAELLDVLEWKEIETAPLFAIMNSQNPISQISNLQLSDLRQEHFVFTSPVSESYNTYIINLCKSHGFTPRVIRYAPNVYSQYMEVNINPNAVCINVIKGINSNPNICCKELPNVFWKMGFAHRKDANKIVKQFVDNVT